MSDMNPQWYRSGFFRDYIRYVATSIPPERTAREVDQLVRLLSLEPGASVLDIACGTGRHAVELARRGFEVTGLDLDETSLELARRRAREAGVEVTLVRADMREIPFTRAFDAAINLMTSFGYLESEEEDERAIAAFCGALRPEGVLLIDARSLLHLVGNFAPRQWHDLPGGARLLADVTYLPLTGRVEARWTVQHANGSETELNHSFRLYTPREMALLMGRSGLAVEHLYGSLGGTEFTLESPRTVFLARKTPSMSV